LLNAMLILLALILPGQESPGGSPPDLGTLLTEYNAGLVAAASSIDTLSVEQVIIDPQDDGSTKEARAILTYGRSTGMERVVTQPGVPYLMGRYTLSSLLGPEIDATEYDVEYEGTEEKEGVVCHRLRLTALVRDADHFDGSLWVSADAPGPVRIVGEVADAPFPAVRVSLDKAFERAANGLWLVRRHSGEVEVSLLVRRRGERHIFYYDYSVVADTTGGTASSRF